MFVKSYNKLQYPLYIIRCCFTDIIINIFSSKLFYHDVGFTLVTVKTQTTSAGMLR